MLGQKILFCERNVQIIVSEIIITRTDTFTYENISITTVIKI
jgi:hypothetical protein